MTEKTPQDVVAHHLAALEQGNLANLMADYAEHAVMMFPDRSLRGHDSIKDFFAEALDQYGRRLPESRSSARTAKGTSSTSSGCSTPTPLRRCAAVTPTR